VEVKKRIWRKTRL